jgi:hypothetical protein
MRTGFEKVEIILERERLEHLLFDWEHLDGWAMALAPSAPGSLCITAR